MTSAPCKKSKKQKFFEIAGPSPLRGMYGILGK